MISDIKNNLQKGIVLLKHLTDAQYADTSTAPYHSSIGNHVRHSLDIFSQIFKGYPSGSIDLSIRQRNPKAENFTKQGIQYCEDCIAQLNNISENELDREIFLTDDTGNGKTTVKTTLGAILLQAQSHTIHHYATIGYILSYLHITVPNSDFGWNPTSIKTKK